MKQQLTVNIGDKFYTISEVFGIKHPHKITITDIRVSSRAVICVADGQIINAIDLMDSDKYFKHRRDCILRINILNHAR